MPAKDLSFYLIQLCQFMFLFRYSKVRKEKNETKYSGMYCNFEIFHMREKQIPVDSVECKEPIQAFAWEPIGQKFAMIHGESPNINVSFYEVSFVFVLYNSFCVPEVDRQEFFFIFLVK